MEEYFKYNPKKFKNRNNQSQLTTHKIKYTSYKDNVLQFSLNAINNILINNLNSTINIGMLNITNNNLQKNKNQIMNKNLYINSLNDCIDYKIKGNIYKISQDNFFDLYPNMSDLITNNLSKNKKELKILKFDREMLVPQTKTPTKEVSKHFYFNLMNYNKNNYEESKDELSGKEDIIGKNKDIDKDKKNNSFSFSSFDNTTNNEIIFDKETKKILDKNETDNNNYYNTLTLETSNSNLFLNNNVLYSKRSGDDSFENCIHALVMYQYKKNKNKNGDKKSKNKSAQKSLRKNSKGKKYININYYNSILLCLSMLRKIFRSI